MNPLVKHRNLGTFVISFDYINELPHHTLTILKDCIILGAYRDNQFEYVSYLAAHNSFPEVAFGTPIPHYINKVVEDINESKDSSKRLTCHWLLSNKSNRVTVPKEEASQTQTSVKST